MCPLARARLLGIVLAVLLGVGVPAVDAQQVRVVFVRAEAAGYYSEIPYLIAEFLESELNARSYEVLVTAEPGGGEALSGAMDIISSIANLSEGDGAYYVGLTQADVAYYFLEGGHPLYPTSHVHRNNVVALSWAYPEFLHIYSANPELCESNASFVEHARSWKELYLGALGSGTLITSTNVLSLLVETAALVNRADPERVRQQFFPDLAPAPAAEAELGGGHPWGGGSVDGSRAADIQNRLSQGEGCLVGLSPSQARHLENIYSRFYRIGSPAYVDRTGRAVELETIEVPAVLVASKRLPREPAELIGEFFDRVDGMAGGTASGGGSESTGEEFLRELADAIGDETKVHPDRVSILYEALERGAGKRPDGETGGGSGRMVDARRSDLILRTHRSMVAGIQPPGFGWVFWITILSLIATAWLTANVVGKWQTRGFFEIPLRIMLPAVILAAVFWTHACVWIVQLLDYDQFMTYGTDRVSPFLTHSYADLVPKLIHHVATAFTTEELFPVRRSAQLVWLTIPLVIIGNMVWGTARLVVPHATAWLKRHFKGGTAMQLENHTVILNWHEHAEDVIRELYAQARLAGDGEREITLVTADVEQVSLPRMMTVSENEHVGEHFVHGIALNNGDGNGGFGGLKPVYVFAGDPAKPATMARLQVEQAQAVIVFPNMALDDPDGPTAITVLNIQRRITKALGRDSKGGKKSDTRKRPKVIAWCANPENVPVFQDESFGLDDVCSAEWAWRIICQASSVPHVSNIYRRLMTSTANTNEFYEFTLPDDWQTCHFHEIEDTLHTFNLEQTETVDGDDERKNNVMLIAYCKRDDTRREDIRINPNPRSEVEGGDTLLVLTYSCNERRRKKILAYLVAHNRSGGESGAERAAD